MKCKKCKRIIEDNSIFCNWCGHKPLTEKTEVRVPVPKKRGSIYSAQLMLHGERVYISAGSEEEYYAKARAAKARLIEVKKAAPRLTLGTAIDNYIEAQTNILSPSTVKAYKSYRKYRFLKYLDRDVSGIDWQQMLNEEAKLVKPKTLANAWRIVTASLVFAGLEASKATLPSVPISTHPWLDYEQIQRFCAAIRGEDCEVAALLALNGLRRSELIALTSNDIDLKNGLILVRGSAVYGPDGTLVRKDTNKNRTSTRTVHIVIPRLLELLKGIDGQIVTTKPNTTYVQVNRICKQLGLPLVGVHGLRHSYASLARHLGWDEMTVMREGGWANTDTVHKVYTHLAAQDANADVQKMEQFYKSTMPI